MKKKIIIAIAALVVLLIGIGLVVARKAGYLSFLDFGKYKGPIVGELKVLSHGPEGPGIPISTDGITVMFNKAVVPLTTLDSGRERSIPLRITPSVSGKFFWLGTHGFIFRPESPLDAATTYHVEMPAGVTSVDGYRLEKPLTWDFSTVAPRILTWEPSDQQNLLPKEASFFLRFNIAMSRSDVEKKLSITDGGTGQILLAKRDYLWGDDGHTLRVRFRDEIPWESQVKIELPQGTRAKTGDLGIAEPVTVTYLTPGKRLELEKVTSFDMMGGEDIILTPNKETLLPAGSGVCFHFSQAITKKSFQKAFHAETTGKKPLPYYYFGDHESYFLPDPTLKGKEGATIELEGYKDGCISFLDEYSQTYRFSIDPAKIASLSGAPLTSGGETYVAKTGRAQPSLESKLTKNILSYKGPMKIPYRVVNLRSVTLRLYHWPDKNHYDEDLKSETIWRVEEKSNPPVSTSLGSTRIKLPVDPWTMTIDQNRTPADVIQEIPIDSKLDVSTHFLLDLGEITALPPNPPSVPPQEDRSLRPTGQAKPDPVGARSLSPGIYLLEVIGNPSPEANAPLRTKDGIPIPGSVYSMIQVTPVGIALKRELDHVLVWTTDLETGTPIGSLPVRLSFERWNSKLGINETVSEANVVTNAQGVAILNQPSTDDVRICAEVTQPGSESYSCESDHKLTGYRDILSPAPHYFAYLYTDRPIYRPGQKVYFSSFVRQVRGGRYFQMEEGTPAIVAIYDSSGTAILENKQATIGRDGVVHGEVELSGDEETPRGEYRLTIRVGDQSFNKVFLVTSYRKPSFKVDLKTSSPEIVSGEDLKVEVQGNYFFGAPLRRSQTSWSIMTSTYDFSPEGFEDYSFIDTDLLYKKSSGEEDVEYASDFEYSVVARSGETTDAEDTDKYDDPRGSGSFRRGGGFFKDPEGRKISNREERLDDEGRLPIRYRPNLKKYPTSQILTVEASVQDPSHQEVSGSEDVIVHKADFYLGLKPEKWTYGEKETAKVRLVSLDTQGKPASGKNFKIDVIRREYKFIEHRTAGGFWNLVFEPEDKKVTTLSGKTDKTGKGEVSFVLPQGGTFRFVARGKDRDGNEIQSATTVYAWGTGYVPWRLDKPETVELVPDKDAYKVGETAKILVKSLVPVTKALATLERGRLLEYKIIDLGGNAAHIEIPITEGMIPNLYLSVVAHVGRTADHPPLLYYGETEIAVEPEQKRLSVTITPNRKGEGEDPPIYRPGDEVKVHLETKDPSGKPQKAHIMVSVADESVLRLLNYKLPDLVKKFYFHRPNSVETSSSLISLKAGDAGSGSGKKRRIFKDTAHFEAHLTTNDQGQVDFSFKLPDDLTTWVIEALAITPSKTTEAFEAERLKALPIRPQGQTALQSDLILTDDTFVGGNRGKIMTTLPLVLRPALPRFAVWGDSLRGQVIANNRNPSAAEGKIVVTVSGDGTLTGGQTSEEISFSIPANAEKAFPVDLSINSAASGRLTFSADAKDTAGQTLDALEVSLPVKDRFAPEVVASSGVTEGEEKELIDLPPDLSRDKGGLDVSFKASLALAAAPSLRTLVYFPWGCSEQKSASLLALLMAREMSVRFGEVYFDQLAPIDEATIKKTRGLDAKLQLLDDKIRTIVEELTTKFQHYSGGIKYWPESRKPNYFASVQTLWGMTEAKAQGFTVDETARERIKQYLRKILLPGSKKRLWWDDRAYGLWGLTLDHTSEFNLTEEALGHTAEMSVSGLSYLLMALKNGGAADASTLDPTPVSGRLMGMAKQEPRHTSWSRSNFFWSSAVKNTSLAALALLVNSTTPDQRQRRVEGEAPTALPAEGATRAPVIDPMVPRALAFLLNRKKEAPCRCTQDNLYLSSLLVQYAKLAREDETDFKATLTANAQTLIEKSFNRENLLSVYGAKVDMKDLMEQKMPIDLKVSKIGTGRLYYDMVLKYYLPPDKTPTREEGLIVSREYYLLDDVKEEDPLTKFEVGENYKGHIVLVVPQEMNYVVVQDLLPAGFEPIDMTLATSSRAAALEASAHDGGGYRDEGWDERFPSYEDVITTEDYGTDYGFQHQEIRDDAIVWSDEFLPPGVYHIRYPVRATTAGTFLMPGADAFEFYEPEIFGRSRSRMIRIEDASR